MSILDQILKSANSNHISIDTIILLNSLYMNEMLDKDIVWQDRTDEEYSNFITDRIAKFVKIGVDLVKFEQSQRPSKLQQIQSKPQLQPNKKSVSFIQYNDTNNNDDDDDNNENNSIQTSNNNMLSDLIDSMPIDENDEYYKKVSKLGKQSSSSSSNNQIRFC